MIKIQNLNFLDILIKNFSKYSINKIYIAAGFKGDKIFKKFHNKKESSNNTFSRFSWCTPL